MKHIASNAKTMWNLLEHDITIDMISEDLWAPEATEDTNKILNHMELHSFDVAGIKTDRVVKQWIDRKSLADGRKYSECVKPIELKQVVSSTKPLWECLDDLARFDWLFVMAHRKICKIVTTADLGKQPSRLLMFGIISLLEMTMTKRVELYYPEDSWKSLLTSQRLDKAKELFEERERLNQEIGMLDCLQFCDKMNICLKTNELIQAAEIPKKEILALCMKAQDIRNYLAHSQDIHRIWDWKKMVVILTKIKQLTRKWVDAEI